MEGGLFPWSDFIVQLSWSDFLKNQFIKPLDPSLDVNRMWTRMDDHAPKSECVDFLNICPKKIVLKKIKNKKITFDHTLGFTTCFSLFPP